MATIFVHYERLPDLCFHCGVLGHPLRECSLRKSMEDVGRPLKYRAWSRAGTALGEEPRGKQSRGDGDQYGGGARQGLPKPKPVSRWKPNVVLPPRMTEKRGSPVLESGTDHRSSAKQKGKAMAFAGDRSDDVDYGMEIISDYGKSTLGSFYDSGVPNMEGQGQKELKVNTDCI
ncbi:hypothetical protein LWI28_015112 [Acer negundo]|uniref:CCHC-type domain-containing protein n=1 Tax=Acer negundo TaxID=4023 RepID=A0AAD5J5K0_ACENE|nr:hypothetical protein LWI28_015112 [Acer negundo]KAK4852429.1 hypothetical protein QYF36_024014 [Acer negundo]